MKKVMKLVIIIALSLGFSGCVDWQTNLHVNKKMEAKNKILRVPNLNKISTAEIGQNMFTKSYLYYENTYDVKLLQSAIGAEGQIWVDSTKKPETSAGQYQFSDNMIKKFREIGDKKIKAMCYSTWICLTDISNSGSFTHFSAFGNSKYSKLNQPVKYKIVPSKPIMREDSFKYIALYQGKKGNSIKISFREFKDNMARPAFTQDIDYELNEIGSTIVGFKGLRIEVIKASNIDIKYKVLKDYN